ncbi:MAG: hypothetical protein J0I77_02655 [Rudaea sp.]|uniref:hypothetical protein n=1 Tax=unclassified Rudaea TaxID=2627037 RepID=UPI0010F8EEE5|nr:MULTISPECIES: hypothetical protein [unclassified Rudaea]MBN8884599.1 hypothetical protein [Rudaea sp.]
MLFVVTSAQGNEKIAYELYKVQEGKRFALASGQRIYDPAKDFVVHLEEKDSKPYGTRKQIEIANGYSVGILDKLDRDVTGFGLWVGHLPEGSNPNRFSWEWFSRAAPGQFKKLLGGGKIHVTFSGMPYTQEISRIEFLDTIELEYIEDICCKSKGDGPTHVLVIEAGSVLAFPTGGA